MGGVNGRRVALAGIVMTPAVWSGSSSGTGQWPVGPSSPTEYSRPGLGAGEPGSGPTEGSFEQIWQATFASSPAANKDSSLTTPPSSGNPPKKGVESAPKAPSNNGKAISEVSSSSRADGHQRQERLSSGTNTDSRAALTEHLNRAALRNEALCPTGKRPAQPRRPTTVTHNRPL